MEKKFEIGILGGGPAALFMFKSLLEKGLINIQVTIIERHEKLGAGMPYSTYGSNHEHITNVSDKEIPKLVNSVSEWMEGVPAILKKFGIKEENFHEFKVFPRLLFGEYLSDQFELILKKAKTAGLKTKVFFNREVTDIEDDLESGRVNVYSADGDKLSFDAVVICTGHHWPKKYEGKVPNWFDSPYPPRKLLLQINYAVAIKGASLTALDAVRSLARANGIFESRSDGTLVYRLNEASQGFHIMLHSLHGLLPAIRFHLEDSQLQHQELLSQEELYAIKEKNHGFVPLDLLFENNFKQPLKKFNPGFYEKIKFLTLEEFVDFVMGLREKLDPITLFKAEYAEAEKSIRRQESVYWKEMLSALSYALNYPAKHFSAEDMLRHKKVLMPLISIIIAMVPQSSCRELLAMHDAGVLTVVEVDEESTVEPATEGCKYTYTNEEGNKITKNYGLFVDAVGQPAFPYEKFPFESLRTSGTVSLAYLRFKSQAEGMKLLEEGNKDVFKDESGNYLLQVPGISINDNFQVLNAYGAFNPRINIMAVPHIAGLNPDFSGLDFCETASNAISEALQSYLSEWEEGINS